MPITQHYAVIQDFDSIIIFIFEVGLIAADLDRMRSFKS